MTAFEQFREQVRTRQPRSAVVLGSGMGNLPERFAEEAALAYPEIPGMPKTSVVGHAGRACLGTIDGVPTLLFRGRLHYYEGHAWETVGGLVRFAAEVGIANLLLTNAAGGIHPTLGPGTVMVLRDHLFLQLPNAWKPTSRPSIYSPTLMRLLEAIVAKSGLAHETGIYAAVTGPTYETPAEIRAFRAAGADAVGMSTAFEAELGASLGMHVAALSCITNRGAGLDPEPLDHKDVLLIAAKAAPAVSRILETLIVQLGTAS